MPTTRAETREERDKATDCVTQPHRFSSLNKTLNKRICEGAWRNLSPRLSLLLVSSPCLWCRHSSCFCVRIFHSFVLYLDSIYLPNMEDKWPLMTNLLKDKAAKPDNKWRSIWSKIVRHFYKELISITLDFINI